MPTNRSLAAWSPRQLGSLLTGWFDASQEQFANAAAVGTWTDRSRTRVDVTQGTGAAKPTYTTGGPGGMPYLAFDGGDYLASASLVGSTWFAPGGNTIFAVLNQTGSQVQNCLGIWESAAPGNRVGIFPTDTDTIYYDYGDAVGGGRITVAQPSGWDGNWHILELHRPAATGNGEILVDGVQLVAGSFSDDLDPTASSPLYIGSYLGSSSFFSGGIAEILICSGELKTVRHQVRHYLSRKYQILVSQ